MSTVQERAAIATLSPHFATKEYKAARRMVELGPLAKVIRAAVMTRSSTDLLTEVYLAGLYHGSSLHPPQADDAQTVEGGK